LAGQKGGDKDTGLVDKIVAALEQAIETGELEPGARISELSLSAILGVSRGPLREAIRKLEARRIVERTAFHGVRLIDLSLADLEQLLVVREALEGMTARTAAANISASQLRQLRVCAEQKLTEMDNLGGAFRLGTRDNDFHTMIAQSCGNRWLADFLCSHLFGLLRIYRFSAGTLGARAPEAYAEHCAILDAIEARDGDAAELRMREHNRNGRAALMQRLRQEQDGRKRFLKPIERQTSRT
jgi:DNA-binding GntR family transcriptional regulator